MDNKLKEVAELLIKGEKCYIDNATNQVYTDGNLGENTNVIEIKAPNSTQSFKMMEAFANSIEDFEQQSELYEALQYEQPFANFRQKVFQLRIHENWNKYRLEKLVEFIADQMK